MVRSKGPWLTLAIVTLVVLGAVTRHEFLDYDDAINITANAEVTHFSRAGLWSFWQKPYINLYIPLTYNLWALLSKISGLLPGAVPGQPNPALFHSANLLLHLAGAGIVLAILNTLCRSPWAACAGAILFAIHPLQVEPVAWATGMKDLLSGFFSLSALWWYLVFARAAVGQQGRWRAYVLAAVAFLLAMLSKPGAVATPALAWIIAVVMLGKRPVGTAFSLLPWLVLAAPVIFVTRLAQAEPHNVFEPAWWQRVLVAGDSLSFYLGKVVAPMVLGPDYGRTPKFVLEHGWSYLTGTFPYCLAGLVWWKGSRSWWAATGIFVCVLLPVSGLVPFVFQQISTVADRYCYLAMLGPALALASWLAAAERGKTVWWIVIAVLAGYGGKSMHQVGYWHERKVFYDHALSVNPRSWTAYNNLGNYFADTNQPQQAIAAYEKAIAIDPEYAEAYNNLGTARTMQKQWHEAIDAFGRAMELNPYYVEAAINLGDAYRAIQYNEEAIGAYNFAIAAGTSSVKPYYSLCTLYQELDRNEEAASCYNKLLVLKPDSAESYNNLGTVYKNLDRHAEAIAAYQQALTLRPDFAEVYNNMGFLYAAEEKFAEAIPLYRKAAELYPGHTMPLRNLALAYSALGQDDEAIGWLQKAIAADPSFAPAFNDLSRIYLKRRDYRQAVHYGVRARELGLVDLEQWQALQPYLDRNH